MSVQRGQGWEGPPEVPALVQTCDQRQQGPGAWEEPRWACRGRMSSQEYAGTSPAGPGPPARSPSWQGWGNPGFSGPGWFEPVCA